MAEETVAQVGKRLDDHVENFKGHTGDDKIHLTRRQALGWGAAGAAVLLTGIGVIKYGWEKLQLFEPEFKVWIYSPERAKGLSEQVQKLIKESENDGYIEVGFDSLSDLVEVDIYQGDPQLLAKNVHIHEYEIRPLTERITRRGEFVYIVEGPNFKNQRKIVAKPNFLDNEKLLANIIKAQELHGWEVDDHYSEFDVDYRRYHGEEIPVDCKIQIKGDPVTYKISGVEVLTPDKNPALFAEYWMRRHSFKDYAAFKVAYGDMTEAQERVKAAEADAKATESKAK